MHDPMIVAHEIKYPWFSDKPWPKQARQDPNPYALRRRWDEMETAMKTRRSRHFPGGYRDTFITIWHVDPQRGGSDDSCGYSRVRLTKKQIEILRNTAWGEGQNAHFLCCEGKEWDGTFTECESLYRGLVFLVCRVLHLKISFDEAAKFASEATHILDCGKSGGVFCFLPGYHTNSERDTEESRQDHFHHILCNVASNILTDRRPWWRRPKWHVWHWKIQCHLWQKIRRFLFERCSKCGGRFKRWGECPISDWNGTKTWHQECDSVVGLKATSHRPS